MFSESKNIQIKSLFDFICFYRKKTFDKIVDVLKGTQLPTMHELGLEFLHVYDGKFNYREGDKVCHSIFIY